MLTDPSAINYIVHKRGYAYPKTRPQKQFTVLAFGKFCP
jgi:hypothetical protein